MSISCQIAFYEKETDEIEDFQAIIYKHSDCSPATLVPIIMPILEKFNNKRGLVDTEYASAYLVYELKKIQESNKPEDLMLGIGIQKELDGKVQYFYKVHPKGIDVYDVFKPDYDIIESFNF